MITRIELTNRKNIFDAKGPGILDAARDLGISTIESVSTFQVYYLLGELNEEEKRRIAENLLSDPVTQIYRIDERFKPDFSADLWSVEITFNRGVTDMVAETALKGLSDLGIFSVTGAKTAHRYEFVGKLTDSEKDLINSKLLMNKVIEHVVQEGEKIFFPKIDIQFEMITIPLSDLKENELIAVSQERDLFLNLQEMKAIQAFFREKDRDPTDVELEMLAQTWSEHCSHKTLTGLIEYEGRIFDNLLKQTVFRVTGELNKPWCLSVFKDNAGVIAFDEDYAVCFKVETHNHPSAMEPYGGANTGIGGVIRDPLGTGMGAKPIINTDIFCFGPVHISHNQLPRGVMHPKRLMQGVVAGVRDYGNRMGIPTSNGAIVFDERYVGNPLVYCGNVGLMPVDKYEKKVMSGDYIIVVGGRTGRDGIHGATASSGELHTESEGTWSGAVQIGNPIVEKKLVDTLMQARDRGLYNAITDCGAGGLSSAIGELAEMTGAEVDLEKVPLKYHGLTYMEIWISEAQERMVIFVSPDKVTEVLELFAGEDVEATVIGRTTKDRIIRLKYDNTVVGELDMEFLHNGLPRLVRKAIWEEPHIVEKDIEEPGDLTPILHELLSELNICSKEWVIRQYDHEVQAGSAVKPLVGEVNDGPSDASVTRPRLDSDRAIVLSNGLNPKYGLIDPYWMAASAIDEAIRNVIAVGGRLERTALLDNFCWGNTDKPDRLGGLVRAALACYDMAKELGTPFISGKDSLNNEFLTGDGESIAIPPTLLISAISVMADAKNAVTMDLKEPNGVLYVIGKTDDEMGGSIYYRIRGGQSLSVPKVDPVAARHTFEALAKAIEKGLVRACHDCSEGGLAVALAEMAFSGGRGAHVDISLLPRSEEVKRSDIALFSESNTRFIVQVLTEKKSAFEAVMNGIPLAAIGKVTGDERFVIKGLDGRTVIDENIYKLKESWQKTLRW